MTNRMGVLRAVEDLPRMGTMERQAVGGVVRAMKEPRGKMRRRDESRENSTSCGRATRGEGCGGAKSHTCHGKGVLVVDGGDAGGRDGRIVKP